MKLDTSKYALIKEARLVSLSKGMLYFVFQDLEGRIIGETLNSTFVLADSLDEYKGMPLPVLEQKIYTAEMSASK